MEKLVDLAGQLAAKYGDIKSNAEGAFTAAQEVI